MPSRNLIIGQAAVGLANSFTGLNVDTSVRRYYDGKNFFYDIKGLKQNLGIPDAQQKDPIAIADDYGKF